VRITSPNLKLNM